MKRVRFTNKDRGGESDPLNGMTGWAYGGEEDGQWVFEADNNGVMDESLPVVIAYDNEIEES